MKLAIVLVISAAFVATAAAQPQPAANSEQVDCRERALSIEMHGTAMRDEMDICMQEQRVTCLKEAIDKKIVAGKERTEFVRRCVGRSRGEN